MFVYTHQHVCYCHWAARSLGVFFVLFEKVEEQDRRPTGHERIGHLGSRFSSAWSWLLYDMAPIRTRLRARLKPDADAAWVTRGLVRDDYSEQRSMPFW